MAIVNTRIGPDGIIMPYTKTVDPDLLFNSSPLLREALMALCRKYFNEFTEVTGLPYPFDCGYEEPEDCWCGTFPLGEDD